MENQPGSNRKNILMVLAILVVIAILIILFRMREKKKEESGFDAKPGAPKHTAGELSLYERMRKLWSEHVFFTRAYVIDYFNSSPETPHTGKRLMRNQEEIGASLIPYYGETVGKKVTSLLKEHISLASKVLVDLRKKDKKNLKKHNDLWYANADKIADALASINENWKKEDIKKELYAHLDSTKQMVTSGMDRKWHDELMAFDKNHEHVLQLADNLAEGISTQFPEKVG